jgi:hypothetical protein
MKISELLTENFDKKSKKPSSNLPSAASIDDEPLDDLEDDDVEDDDQSENSQENIDQAVELFKKYGAKFGPDLYSFSSIDYPGEWSSRNAIGLISNIAGIDLKGAKEAFDSMNNASGDYGAMTFVILNSRSGEIIPAGFGDGGGGIEMNTLEPDQERIIGLINRIDEKYTKAGGGADDEATNASNRLREHLLDALNYYDQEPKNDEDPTKKLGYGMGFDSWDEETRNRIAADSKEIIKAARAKRAAEKAEKERKKAERAAKAAIKQNPAGRKLR